MLFPEINLPVEIDRLELARRVLEPRLKVLSLILPFEAIPNPAHRRLPHAALVALNSDGSLAYGAIAGSILRDPGQIPQLLRIAHDAQAAFLSLSRSRKLIAGTLGFTDFREFLLDVPAEDVLGGPLQV